MRKWSLQKNIGNAIELIDAAVVSGQLQHGEDAARFLLSPQCSTTDAVKHMARFVLRVEENDRLVAEHGNLSDTLRRSVCQKQIAALRRRLGDYPMDAFSWLEIGRLQTSLGQLKPARQAVMRALGSSQENRVILRAASRFFLHVGDKDFAHRVLAASGLVRFDPWVQAAEIAMAHVAGRSSVSLANALKSLRDEKLLSPRRSELAAAVATEEMHTGRIKSARKLMNLSLTFPTDNSLAQGLWMRNNMRLEISPLLFHVPSNYEANTRAFAEAREFESAIWHCFQWLLDEPYSTRPAVAGSYFAAAIMQDHHQALAFIQRGLTANPSDIVLRNNQVVSLVYLGDLDEAERIFGSIHIHSQNERTIALLQATAGLLSFRRNQIKEGRRLYASAVEYGIEKKLPHFVLTARVY
jgi:tetratricopeptide (TPR) repeat protein